MNRLRITKRSQIGAALVEVNSVRATCLMIGAAKGTVLSLLVLRRFTRLTSAFSSP